MKSVSNDYKEQLTALGRQYNVLVNYTVNGTNHTLSNSELNVVTPHYQGDLLKSTMKQLDLDSNVDIPIGTEINCQFGLLVGNDYEYIDYGNYIVYSSEKQEDLKSYKIVCYDKMLNAMKDYEALTSKNLLPNNAVSQTINGVTLTINGDGSVTASGTASGFVQLNMYGNAITPGENILNNGTYILSGGINNNQKITLRIKRGSSNTYIDCGATPLTFTIDSEVTGLWYYVNIANGQSINATFYPMIRLSNESDANYQPYLQTAFPMSVKDYLTTLSYNLNIPLATQSFVNDDVEISNEKYLDENGGNLGYTYRDVLDDLAQVTASTICLNENDELEVRYITNSQGNLLDNSTLTQAPSSEDNWSMGTMNNVTSSSWGENGLTVTTPSGVGVTNNGRTITLKNANSIIPAGKKVTFSIDITGSAVYGHIKGFYKGDSQYWYSKNVIIVNNTATTSNDTIRYSGTFIMPDVGTDVKNFYIDLGQGNQAVTTRTYKNAMLEFGEGTYYTESGANFDETYLKDTNVNFKEKYGPINSVVFSRSGDSDLIFRKDDESIEENGLCELKIKDNQLLNDNDRDNFIDEIFNKVKGLEFYINDYVSTGLTILELCDKYNVKVGENIYPCIMLNDELNVTQGFDETIHTDKPDTSVSDYKKADTTDRRINQAYLIVDKQNQQITALTSRTNNLATQVNNDKQELLNKFGDYATNSQVQSLTTQVSNIQTDTYTKTEVSQILKGTFYDENNNQVVSEVVKTISGTFDENGMTYAKTNAKTSTTINEIGVRVNNTTSSAELLFAGYDDSISQTIVRTDNLLVRNFLNIGSNSRLQDYETGTGVFDI